MSWVYPLGTATKQVKAGGCPRAEKEKRILKDAFQNPIGGRGGDSARVPR
jgi:hypothetical protein